MRACAVARDPLQASVPREMHVDRVARIDARSQRLQRCYDGIVRREFRAVDAVGRHFDAMRIEAALQQHLADQAHII
jgi:hypothetical protein